MRELLLKVEWALAQWLNAVVNWLERRIDHEPPPREGFFMSTLRADDPFWYEDGNTRYVRLGENFGLVFERKERGGDGAVTGQ